MKKLYEFIFFCLYSMMPKKSMYGQRNAAVVLMSLIVSAAATSFYFFAMIFIYKGLAQKTILAIAIGIITIGSFYLNSKYFDNRKNFKQVMDANEPIRLSHKLLGGVIFLMTFMAYLLTIRFLDLFVEGR